jgi:hypothetical protein
MVIRRHSDVSERPYPSRGPYEARDGVRVIAAEASPWVGSAVVALGLARLVGDRGAPESGGAGRAGTAAGMVQETVSQGENSEVERSWPDASCSVAVMVTTWPTASGVAGVNVSTPEAGQRPSTVVVWTSEPR